MKHKMIKSEHHGGREVPLHKVLGDIAAQEGNDCFEYDMMQEASEYIKMLELQIEEMEKNLLG